MSEVVPKFDGHVVLFDLDGTLTDPFEGITRSIRYALESLGQPAPPAAELSWCIGPPLLQSFMRLLSGSADAKGGTGEGATLHEEAQEALRLYRVRFADVGMLENQVYDGVSDVLTALSLGGCRLYLATSKPRVYAEPIMKHFGLLQWFQGIYGSELDGTRSRKAELLSFILQQEQLLPERAVMVGDRKHDIEAAREVGMRSLAVDYGYAAPGELVAAMPDATVGSPQEIIAGLKLLFRHPPA